VSGKRSAAPDWATGLPAEAIIPGRKVPELPRGRSMTFEARWRAVTMARLYGRCTRGSVLDVSPVPPLGDGVSCLEQQGNQRAQSKYGHTVKGVQTQDFG
jgi:hypothetical protein